jgi:hypothetical protein
MYRDSVPCEVRTKNNEWDQVKEEPVEITNKMQPRNIIYYSKIYLRLMYFCGLLTFINLIFMDPWIVVWISWNNQQDATL